MKITWEEKDLYGGRIFRAPKLKEGTLVVINYEDMKLLVNCTTFYGQYQIITHTTEETLSFLNKNEYKCYNTERLELTTS